MNAARVGVDGMVLSNHGGRQIDTARSGIEILVEVSCVPIAEQCSPPLVYPTACPPAPPFYRARCVHEGCLPCPDRILTLTLCR